MKPVLNIPIYPELGYAPRPSAWLGRFSEALAAVDFRGVIVTPRVFSDVRYGASSSGVGYLVNVFEDQVRPVVAQAIEDFEL